MPTKDVLADLTLDQIRARTTLSPREVARAIGTDKDFVYAEIKAGRVPVVAFAASRRYRVPALWVLRQLGADDAVDLSRRPRCTLTGRLTRLRPGGSLPGSVRPHTGSVTEQPATPDRTGSDSGGRDALAPGASMGQWARWYTGLGWRVLPVTPGGKKPLISEWEKRATTDATTIEGWWARWPNANIGLLTGYAFDVIDFDGQPGEEARAWLLGNSPVLDHPLAVVKTPHGQHYYARPSGRHNGARLVPGVDYRGLGGQVVAPPSLCDGVRYEFVQPPGPGDPTAATDADLDQALDGYAEALGNPRASTNGSPAPLIPTAALTDPATAPEQGQPGLETARRYLATPFYQLASTTRGSRNDTLHSVAAECGRLRLSVPEAEALL